MTKSKFIEFFKDNNIIINEDLIPTMDEVPVGANNLIPATYAGLPVKVCIIDNILVGKIKGWEDAGIRYSSMYNNMMYIYKVENKSDNLFMRVFDKKGSTCIYCAVIADTKVLREDDSIHCIVNIIDLVNELRFYSEDDLAEQVLEFLPADMRKGFTG